MKIDYIYVISIDHSEKNINLIEKKLDKFNFTYPIGYTILDGINGREIFKDKYNIKNFGYEIYDITKNHMENDWWKRQMSAGEIGCVLSHIKVWEDAYLSNYKNVLILEDDFELIDENLFWDVIENSKMYDFEIILFDLLLQSQIENIENRNINSDFFVEPGFSYNAHAYIINNIGLKRINDINLPILKSHLIPTDEFLPSIYSYHPRNDFRCLFQRNLRALTPKESIITQNRFSSNGVSLTDPIHGIDF